VEQPPQVDARRTCPLPDHHHAGAPAFRQVVDGRRGCVGAAGDLNPRTADQLRGTVEALRRGGHRRILVDLHGLHSADEPGLRALDTLRAVVEADGGRLTLLHLPEADGASEQRPA
jgi:anti-anti-sigma regulatory factor